MARRNPFRSEAEAFRLLLAHDRGLRGDRRRDAARWLEARRPGLDRRHGGRLSGGTSARFPRSRRAQAPRTCPRPRRAADCSSSRTRPLPVESSATAIGGGRHRASCPGARRHARRSTRSSATGPRTRTARASRPRRGSARASRGSRSRASTAHGKVGDCGSAAGDRGRVTDVRRRRDHHLDASRGPVQLARARRGGHRRGSASPCRSRTSSSTSADRTRASEEALVRVQR